MPWLGFVDLCLVILIPLGTRFFVVLICSKFESGLPLWILTWVQKKYQKGPKKVQTFWPKNDQKGPKKVQNLKITLNKSHTIQI